MDLKGNVVSPTEQINTMTDLPDTVSESVSNRVDQLPPCRVCGATASGFHYGANTCEACKIFFMRSLRFKPKYQYKCSKPLQCQIKPNKRNCHVCRFQRCLSVGMSKTAIKIGKYTDVKRQQIREEVETQTQVITAESELNTEDLYKEIAQQLSESSKLHDVYGRVPRDPDELLRKQKDYLAWYWACHSAIGDRNPISESEYKEIYAATGLDVDNRYKILNNTVLMFQHGIEKQVKFSKTIPGFKKLSLSDQANIIKASSFDYLWLCAARCVNAELSIGPLHTGCMYTLDHIRHVLDEYYVEESFMFSGKLNQLELRDEETALLKAVCIMFTDRVLLEDKPTVDRIQWNLLECLRWHIMRNHDTHKQTFYKIWNCVLMLREISEKSRRFVESVHMRCPEHVNCALLRETSIS